MEENLENAGDAAINVGRGILNETKSLFHFDEMISFITWGNVSKIITSVVTIVLFWAVYRVLRHIIRKTASKTLQKRTVNKISKGIGYAFYILITMYILGLFGIDLGAVWGAAGIAGVAIGFAAQTSVSNLISGLFVFTEKTMKTGDYIEVDGVCGTIDSIGLLAIKIRTLDNQLIRIPNSTIINTKVMNYSSFDYRRYVFEMNVDYSTDLEKAIEVLNTVPAKCPTVILDKADYAPVAFCTTLGESGIGMSLAVWCKRPDFLATKNKVCIEVVKAFGEAGINIPFNRMDVSILSENTNPSLNLK